MRQFFLDRVRMDPLMDGQNYIYMHYADMIANGYHRTAPCPFMTQGIMLNPNFVKVVAWYGEWSAPGRPLTIRVSNR